jgi:hypothetical protein
MFMWIVYYALLIYTTDDILNTNDKLLIKLKIHILWLKVVLVLILIHPPLLSIPTIGIREGPSRNNLTT